MSDWFAGTSSGDEEYSRLCKENDRRARLLGYRSFGHMCDEERKALPAPPRKCPHGFSGVRCDDCYAEGLNRTQDDALIAKMRRYGHREEADRLEALISKNDALAAAARELLAWYGPFNPTKHSPEINGAWLRLEALTKHGEGL